MTKMTKLFFVAALAVVFGTSAAIADNLNDSDLRQLKILALKELGPTPDDARGYTAHMTQREGPPAPGCVRIEARNEHGIWARWKCPLGTIQRLGW